MATPSPDKKQLFAAARDITERKRAEKALVKSDALLNATQSLSKIGGWEFDVEKQTLHWTDEVYRIHDIDPAEIEPGSTTHISRSVECYEPDDRPVILAAFQQCVQEGKPYDLEVPFTTVKGRKLWIRTTGNPVWDNGKVVAVIGNIMDITERKNVLLAAESLIRRNEILMQNALEGIHILDDQGNIIETNDAFCRHLGYTKAEALQLSVFDWEAKLTADEVRTNIRKLLDGHAVFESVHRRKDGSLVDVEVSLVGVVLEGHKCLYATCRDITERKKAEAELRLHSEIISRAGEGVSLMRASDATILFANPQFEKMFGYAPGELIGMSVSRLNAPTDKAPEETAREIIKSLEDTGKWKGEVLNIKKSGETFWTLASVTIFNHPEHGQVWIVAQSDITERKKAEESLRASQEQFRIAQDMSPDGFTILRPVRDAQEQVVDFTWVYENAAIARLNGTDSEAVVGRRLLELFPGHRGTPILRAYQQVAESGETCILDIDYSGESMSKPTSFRLVIVPMSENIAILAQDMTARKLAELVLAQSELNFRTVANFTNDWETWREPDGRFRYVSPSCERITGYPPERFIADPDFLPSIILDQDIETYNAHLATSHSLANSGQNKEHEPDRVLFRITRKDGEVRWIEHVCQRVYDEKGVWLGMRGSNRDITEMVTARAQAEAATKLKDQFVSLVAHDLRSPFTSMMGLLRLFAGRKSLIANEEDQKVLDAVFKSGDRMLTMIEDLLKISRLHTGKITPQPRFFKGHIAVAVTIGSISHTAAQKGIVIINDVPVDTRLYADQSLFDEVLLNLLSNAIKFCSKGDKITFFIPPGLRSAIAVRDTGKGIEGKFISNLFKPELQTSTRGTAGEMGTGLGLPFSHDIMKAHGGELTVESAPGKGSVFTAILPYVRPIALVVDDEPMARILVRIHLEKTGIEVIEAFDGEQALEVIKDKRPHIVITDINMPGMDGFTLLDRLKQESATKEIPVIVMTSADGETRENAFRHGANDFVKKPIEMEDFIPRVRRFVG
jgi:PAS domain S-box-containing protein